MLSLSHHNGFRAEFLSRKKPILINYILQAFWVCIFIMEICVPALNVKLNCANYTKYAYYKRGVLPVRGGRRGPFLGPPHENSICQCHRSKNIGRCRHPVFKANIHTQWDRKFKKFQAKKLVKTNKSKKCFHEIAFLAVLNFFPVQKLIFCHFWNCKKWNLSKHFFVKLICLISRGFLAWTFF